MSHRATMTPMSTTLTRRERLVLFAVFAIGLLAAMAHEWNIPQYCLRLLAPSHSSATPAR